MTRDEIIAELRQRAGLPSPEPPPGMTTEETAAWLQKLIDQRQAEMGLRLSDPSPSTETRRPV
jgi:hypothetical protein